MNKIYLSSNDESYSVYKKFYEISNDGVYEINFIPPYTVGYFQAPKYNFYSKKRDNFFFFSNKERFSFLIGNILMKNNSFLMVETEQKTKLFFSYLDIFFNQDKIYQAKGLSKFNDEPFYEGTLAEIHSAITFKKISLEQSYYLSTQGHQIKFKTKKLQKILNISNLLDDKEEIINIDTGEVLWSK